MSPTDAVTMAQKASLLSDKGLMLLAIISLVFVLLACLCVVWRFMTITLQTIKAELSDDRNKLGEIINRNTAVVAENTSELRETRFENRKHGGT